jgi:hypothetical protein
MDKLVLYKVITDEDPPQMMVGRDLDDIAKACQEWCGVIKSAEFVMDIDYVTNEAIEFLREGE